MLNENVEINSNQNRFTSSSDDDLLEDIKEMIIRGSVHLTGEQSDKEGVT